jgi:hypothetical protein
VRLERIIYQPKARVHFTKDEIDALWVMAIRHYDLNCKSTTSRGGILYELRNLQEMVQNNEVMREFAYRELDMLAKVCEGTPLSWKVGELLESMNAMFKLMNPL